MDPRNPKQLARLTRAIERSREKLGTYRKKRYETIQQYVGYQYSDDGTKEPVPINIIEMAVSIYTANLSGGEPKARVTTPIQSLKRTAFDLQLDVNHVSKACGFKRTLQYVVREALYGPGVVKIGIAASKNGGEYDPGEVFVDLVDGDDWVQDMTVRMYEHGLFAGHKMPMVRADLVADPEVDQEVLAKIKSSERSPFEDGEDRVESIGAGGESTEEDFIDESVWVWNIWLRRENVIVMVPADVNGKPEAKLLKVTPYVGPESGPFELTCFNPVPGNVMPLPPLAVLRDLHDIINIIYNKLGRQGVRQKNITVVDDSLVKDGERQIDAADGEAVRGNAKAVTSVNMGGADERNMALGIHFIDRANAAGGNLAALGGLEPSSDTLGQERIIKASASQRINAMQGVVADFVAAVQKQIAFYEFSNPLLNRTLYRKIPGTNVTIPVQLTQARLTGEFLDFNFEMAAYTNKARTPADQLEAVSAIFNQYVVPYLGPMAEQQIAVDFGGLLRTVGDLADVDVDDFIQFGVPSSVPTQEMRGQDPRAAIPRQPTPPRPPAPRRPDPNRMIQDLMSRPQPQMAGVS